MYRGEDKRQEMKCSTTLHEQIAWTRLWLRQKAYTKPEYNIWEPRFTQTFNNDWWNLNGKQVESLVLPQNNIWITSISRIRLLLCNETIARQQGKVRQKSALFLCLFILMACTRWYTAAVHYTVILYRLYYTLYHTGILYYCIWL